MEIPKNEIDKVVRMMATGEIKPQEVILAKRTIHGGETGGENPRGVLLLDDLTYHWINDIESYRRVMRVHQVQRGEVQFRYIGTDDPNKIPATLKVIEQIRKAEREADSSHDGPIDSNNE